jgi:hypothetical protein
MEKMRKDLKTMAIGVQFIAVNSDDAKDYQKLLAAECTFPLLQDDKKVDAWGQLEGGKDDFYVYDSAGKLQIHLPANGAVSVDLSTLVGYNNVKSLAVAVQ